MLQKFVKRYFLLMTSAIIFLADRLIKHLSPSISVEGGFIKFGFYKNYAGAFSLPIAGWLYNIAGIILLGIFFYFLIKEIKIPLLNSSPFIKGGGRAGDLKLFAYGLIFFGGLSNMIDRLYHGYTIDYVNFLNFSFFNLADGMIIMGIATLLYCHIVKNKKQCNNVTM